MADATVRTKIEKLDVTHLNVRESIVFLIVRLLTLDIVATSVALIFFSPFLFPLPMEIKLQIAGYNIWYFLLLFLVKVILTLFVVLQWLNHYYEITSSKIFYRRGIIWRKEDVYDLAQIRSIGIQQGLLGRILNYGTLFFYDRGVYKYYYLSFIHNPLRYLDVLHRMLPDADVEKDVIRQHIRDKQE